VPTRRQFLVASAALGVGARARGFPGSRPVVVNDIHSRLNATRVDEVVRVESVEDLRRIVRSPAAGRKGISIAAGRHAMGGQQFGEGTVLLDMNGMNRVLGLDAERGLVEAEAGAQWPALIARLLAAQAGRRPQWGIVQKQTGADRLSLGGALSANVHGRGLALKPIVGDVESFLLVNAEGDLLRCSRTENAELFRLAIGGYGLFGVIARVTLRLAPRRKVQRLAAAFERRIAEGFLYGDFQYATDEHSPDFLRRGVFSCYRRCRRTPRSRRGSGPWRRRTGGASCSWPTRTSHAPSRPTRATTGPPPARCTGRTRTRRASTWTTTTAGSTSGSGRRSGGAR
jgi:hypothetical protein